MKKIVSVLLVTVIIFSFSLTAFADTVSCPDCSIYVHNDCNHGHTSACAECHGAFYICDECSNTGYITCEQCYGRGCKYCENKGKVACDKCGGELSKMMADGIAELPPYHECTQPKNCPVCTCETCEGTGFIEVNLWEEEAMSKIASANGEIAIIPFDSTHMLTSEMLQAATKSDSDLVLDYDNYSWKIFSNTIKRTSTDNSYDLSIKLIENYTQQKSPISSENFCAAFSIAYDGEFPFSAELTFPVGEEYNEKNIYLCRHEKDGTITCLEKCKAENGYVIYSFNHASTYVLLTGGEVVDEFEKAAIAFEQHELARNYYIIAASGIVLVAGMIIILVYLSRKKGQDDTDLQN